MGKELMKKIKSYDLEKGKQALLLMGKNGQYENVLDIELATKYFSGFRPLLSQNKDSYLVVGLYSTLNLYSEECRYLVNAYDNVYELAKILANDDLSDVGKGKLLDRFYQLPLDDLIEVAKDLGANQVIMNWLEQSRS